MLLRKRTQCGESLSGVHESSPRFDEYRNIVSSPIGQEYFQKNRIGVAPPSLIVIPAQAGIQTLEEHARGSGHSDCCLSARPNKRLDSGLRRNDGVSHSLDATPRFSLQFGGPEAAAGRGYFLPQPR